MKFKVGDIIAYKMDGKPEIEGVIINHWKVPNPWTAGTIDNVDLFITFDASRLCKLHKIDTYHDLNPDVWELKK
jgi:hypothetical protein